MPFYGWFIVGVGMLVTFSSGPAQSYLFAIFLDPIIEDTGLNRTIVSSVYASGTFISALAVFTVSRMADRYGSRLMLMVIAGILGFACLSLAFGSGLIMLGVSMALLRGLGQGALPINSSLLISQWFIRNRGRAMSIMSLGTALSIATLPSVAQWLIGDIGWRAAYGVFGLMIWLLVIPAAIFVVRDRPEQVGLYPDGDHDISADDLRRAKQLESGDQRKVLTSLKFWLIAIPMALPAVVDTALVFHQVSLFQRQGLSAEVAAAVFVPFAAASASMGLAAGFIIDRTGPRHLFIANMFVFLMATIAIQIINTPLTAAIYSALLGGAMGVGGMVGRYTWAYYYGRHGLGRVQGSAMMVMITGSALGPVIFATLAESPGGYMLAFATLMVLVVVAAVCKLAYHPVPE